MPPLRRCLSLFVPPFWQAFRKRLQVPAVPSTLFGMRRSYWGEERSNAYARQPGLKLKWCRGKAIKRDKILVDILTFDGFFDGEFDILKGTWSPEHQGIDLADAMSRMVGELGEEVGEPSARIDIIELACLGQRG